MCGLLSHSELLNGGKLWSLRRLKLLAASANSSPRRPFAQRSARYALKPVKFSNLVTFRDLTKPFLTRSLADPKGKKSNDRSHPQRCLCKRNSNYAESSEGEDSVIAEIQLVTHSE